MLQYSRAKDRHVRHQLGDDDWVYTVSVRSRPTTSLEELKKRSRLTGIPKQQDHVDEYNTQDVHVRVKTREVSICPTWGEWEQTINQIEATCDQARKMGIKLLLQPREAQPINLPSGIVVDPSAVVGITPKSFRIDAPAHEASRVLKGSAWLTDRLIWPTLFKLSDLDALVDQDMLVTYNEQFQVVRLAELLSPDETRLSVVIDRPEAGKIRFYVSIGTRLILSIKGENTSDPLMTRYYMTDIVSGERVTAMIHKDAYFTVDGASFDKPLSSCEAFLRVYPYSQLLLDVTDQAYLHHEELYRKMISV